MIRCDLCNTIDGIAWTYRTINMAETEEEAMRTGAHWSEDEEWAVCMDCHILIENRDHVGVFKRALYSQMDEIKATMGTNMPLVNEWAQEVKRIHMLFWKYLDPRPPTPEPGYRMPIELNEG